MNSYYEINVAKNGVHFFATTPRSIQSENSAKTMFDEFTNRFPANEGFNITCVYWKSEGKCILG